MGQVKEKLNAVRNILHLLWHNIGMDAPENHEEIVQYVLEDVNECADPDEWHSGDVAIAFRRWIEAQASENVRDGATLIPVTECTNGMVDSKGKVIMYGDTIDNVQQLRHIMSDLDDHDQLTLVTCDELGDEVDHYPMAIDVIDNIRLTDDTIVREVQFVQRPNSEPDTRDKQPLVDRVIDEIEKDMVHGDVTVLDELLLKLPYEILRQALPEEMWKDFPYKQ
jgi:hypothetical protein